MAKAKSKKQKEQVRVHGIENLGIAVTAAVDGALYNAEVLSKDSATILTNPIEYIDDLKRMSPFWGSVAMRVLTKTIGYFAVNTVLWNFRKRNSEPKVQSGIDWLNDSIAQMKEKESAEATRIEQGHNTLPFVDGTTLLGAYKYLYVQISGDPPITNFEMPTPAVLYASMQKERDGEAIMAEYEKFENERLKNSASFKYLEAAVKRNNEREQQRVQNKQQQELDHIHRELAGTQMEHFSNDVWLSLPLWTQYKIVRSLHKQFMSAIVAEDTNPPEERIHKPELMELADVVLLELEAARREPQVMTAFEKNVLKEQHDLMS